ncbi:hypothetical protein [Micromonospora pattaloongensis]|nr:hypothetical protein [Micromonospora pattaloongensis]
MEFEPGVEAELLDEPTPREPATASGIPRDYLQTMFKRPSFTCV